NELQDIKSGSSSGDALSGQLIPRPGPGAPGVPAVRPPSGEAPVPYQYPSPAPYPSQPPAKAPTPIRNLVFAGFMALLGVALVSIVFQRFRSIPNVSVTGN